MSETPINNLWVPNKIDLRSVRRIMANREMRPEPREFIAFIGNLRPILTVGFSFQF